MDEVLVPLNDCMNRLQSTLHSKVTHSPYSSKYKTARMANKQIRQIFNDKQYATHESCVADTQPVSLRNSMACFS